MFDTGYQLYLNGQYKEAAIFFEQAWQEDPQSLDGITALNFLDKSMVAERDDSSASLERLNEIASAYAGTLLGAYASQFMTWRLMQAGRYNDAITNATGILNEYALPNFQAYAWHDLGMSYMHGLNDQDRGEQAFRTLVKSYPGHRLARLALIELGEWTGEIVFAPQTDEAASKSVPQQHALLSSVPNPFNPTTTIRYDLPEVAPVRLVIYNILGQQVRTLVDAIQQPGSYTVVWNGQDEYGRAVASGVYIYRLETGSFTASRKMTLLR